MLMVAILVAVIANRDLVFYVVFVLCCFFFNDTATTEFYPLSLHAALPFVLCGFTRIFAKHGGKDASERRSDGWDDTEKQKRLSREK